MKKALPWILVCILLVVVVVLWSKLPQKNNHTTPTPGPHDTASTTPSKASTRQTKQPPSSTRHVKLRSHTARTTPDKRHNAPNPRLQPTPPTSKLDRDVFFSKYLLAPNSTGYKVFRIEETTSKHHRHPRWSSDGKQLAYEVQMVNKRTTAFHILASSADSTSFLTGAFSRSIWRSPHPRSVFGSLAWSPTTRDFLYTHMSNGSTYDLFHSTKGRLLASSPSHSEGHPAWSSNGKYIAFASDRTGRGDLYYARFGKAKAKRLTQHSDSTEMFPVWSPTRSLQLAYVRHTEKTDRIHIIDNIFTRRTRRLTRWNQNVAELHPSWSPDGKHIAFFAQHPKRSGFYIGRDKCDLVVSDVSGKVHTLAIDVVKSEAFGPTWSPDGSQIFYVANRGKRAGMIHSISLKTGTIRHFPTKTRANNELAITAHNNRWILAFTSTGRTDDPPRKYRRLHLVSIRPTQSKTN